MFALQSIQTSILVCDGPPKSLKKFAHFKWQNAIGEFFVIPSVSFYVLWYFNSTHKLGNA